ncbi:uncharacterized protein FSUBG_6273 [Fusarium subglutinans]|uniref:Uncharacterized protein n=1 Tax=Gibberella subglutinans TaxID=42677 RepID=A0A8H5PZL8_GIBSU|nr:uncharacterized protein FSUBG_6273 [Fusarium subglutinans]KAF5605937.1 hypothetical protein FSUBG_6273 [Fusarium subglutinans]
MNRIFHKPSPYFLSNSELLSLKHMNPSKSCLDKLDKMPLSKFSEFFYCDPPFHRFMCYVVRVQIGTPEMVAYWLMKNWAAEVREEVYGVRTETGYTSLAKLETMDDEDFSVYMADANFNKFVTQVVRLRLEFPPSLRMGVAKLRARMVSDGLLTV